MELDEIKLLCGKYSYTGEERGKLEAAAKEYGVPIPQCGCADKWNDLAMQIYMALKSRLGLYMGVIYQYRKNYTTIVGNVQYNGKTDVRLIERLKKENNRVFRELYKERI